MFNLGLITLEDKGKGEVLFWDVAKRRTNSHSRKSMFPRNLMSSDA
jgi:arginine decarboxylase-like protein